MFAFFKAVILGAIFSFVLSALIGHAGDSGGLAHIQRYMIEGVHFRWSWVLFLVGAGLAYAILLMLD
jgi:hypothetical protein